MSRDASSAHFSWSWKPQKAVFVMIFTWGYQSRSPVLHSKIFSAAGDPPIHMQLLPFVVCLCLAWNCLPAFHKETPELWEFDTLFFSCSQTMKITMIVAQTESDAIIGFRGLHHQQMHRRLPSLTSHDSPFHCRWKIDLMSRVIVCWNHRKFPSSTRPWVDLDLLEKFFYVIAKGNARKECCSTKDDFIARHQSRNVCSANGGCTFFVLGRENEAEEI